MTSVDRILAEVTTDGAQWNEDAGIASYDLKVADLADLIAEVDSAPAPTFLFRPVWPQGDHGVIAKPEKDGKTWDVSDAAVSVASGTPWLGIFSVESPGSVLMFVGEGGKRKVVRRIRAICASRGIDVASLPIRVCLRVPHLTSEAAMLLVEDEIAEHRPALVIIDPLYLAARGARGSDLYEMGSHLERVQVVTQRYGASLMVTHHWNQTGQGRGAKRMSGAGPAAWGRVLISGMVTTRHTDAVTGATTVTLELDFQGDEIAETTIRLRRRIWADDPNDLASALHYEVCQLDTDDRSTDPELADLRPAAIRVLRMLEAAADPLTVSQIGDALATDATGLSPLKRRTIDDALARLSERDLAEPTGILGGAGQWRATSRATREPGTPDFEQSDRNAF